MNRVSQEEDIVKEPKATLMEQHLGTILQVLVVALLGWSLSTTMNLSKDVEVLKVQVMALTSALARDGGQFTEAEAARKCQELRDADARLERRIERLEELRRR